MAVETKHVSANLRFTGTARERVLSLNRVRPGLMKPEAEAIIDAIQQICDVEVGNTSMTVTTELKQA